MAKSTQNEQEKYREYIKKGCAKRDKKHYKRAMNYFSKALPLSNDGDAEFEIGCLYYHGQGVDKSYDEAMKWMFKAARKRHVSAMLNVGCWYDGAGGKEQENKKRAARWFYRATIAGDDMAPYRLGCLYYNGDGIEKDERKGEYLALLAAGKAHYHVYDLLGIIYGKCFEKNGKELDFYRAEYWFKKAIASDEEEYLEHDKAGLAELYRLAGEKSIEIKADNYNHSD